MLGSIDQFFDQLDEVQAQLVHNGHQQQGRVYQQPQSSNGCCSIT